MPQIYNKLNAEPIDAGEQLTKIRVFDPAKGVDTAGGILRDPGGGGGRPGTALFDASAKLWDDYCVMQQYGVQARQTNGKMSGEVWATMTCTFQRTKPYTDGYIVQVLKTGEWFQVQGAINVSGDDNVKMELTCRRVQ